MEFGRVSGDHYAGYVVEDSDLEYSDCSEADSSEDESCTVGGGVRGKCNADLSSEDEFEKEMDSEAVATLRLMVSPTAAAQAVKGHVTRATPSVSGTTTSKPQTGKASRVLARARQRRSSTEQQRKTVRFSGDVKTDDMEEGANTVSDGPEATQSEEKTTEPGYYDDIYSDSSGSEDERDESEGIRKVGKRIRKMTNDELFYDPKMDEEDEKWMKRQRMTYLNAAHQLEQKKKQTLANQIDSFSGPSKSSKTAPPPSSSSASSTTSQSTQLQSSTDVETCVLPKSDAVLNCPACMTTLCLDCQRHDIYTNQYRAMFVLNCCILRDEVLKYFPKPDKRSRKRNRGKHKQTREQVATAEAGGGGGERSEEEGAELYHPVRCSQCNTEVAVYDKDEVYHFFNVLTSAPG